MFRKIGFTLMLFACLMFTGIANATQPLITDDAFTQGAGHGKIEVGFEQSYQSSNGVSVTESIPQARGTFGITDNVDAILTVPYMFSTVETRGVKVHDNGIRDLVLEAKWKFYECNGFNLAVKPGLIIPTGDSELGYGAGEFGGSAYLIATQVIDPFAIHANVGYIRNQNDIGEGENIWHTSVGAEWKAAKWMKVVADVGAEGGRLKYTDTPEGFVLGGFVFPVTDNFALDVAAKGMFMENADAGYALLTGVTYRF